MVYTQKVEETIIVNRKITIDIGEELKYFTNGDENVDEINRQFNSIASLILTKNPDIISGSIVVYDNWFEFEFTTNEGDFKLTQEGEYHMYGGPYCPKMKKPVIYLDGRDISDDFITHSCRINLPWIVSDGGPSTSSHNQVDLLVELFTEGTIIGIKS